MCYTILGLSGESDDRGCFVDRGSIGLRSTMGVDAAKDDSACDSRSIKLRNIHDPIRAAAAGAHPWEAREHKRRGRKASI